jgi:dolichol-phosphate mannosyltransferase
MRVMVTGGSGFVGANLVRRLVTERHEVHLLLRRSHQEWRLDAVADLIHRHEVDIGDRDRVDRTFKEVAPDWTFHLAAEGAYSWQSDLERMIAVNIVGTRNVVESAINSGCHAIVNAGSSSEYGFVSHAPSEGEPVAPNSDYAVTKVAATHICQLLSRQSGVPVTTLRLYSAYGPLEDERRLVPTLIRRGRSGGLPALVDPARAHDFIFVDDVCSAFIQVAGNVAEVGEIFNVGTGIQTTIGEIVEIARNHFGISSQPEWGSHPRRHWDTNTWIADPSKLRALGWQPKVSLAAGFMITDRALGVETELEPGPTGLAVRSQEH